MLWPLIASSIAIAGAACDDKAPQTTAPTVGTTAEVEQVVEEPMDFYGKRVRLNGEVDRVFGPRAFELEGEGVWWDDQILVVTRAPVTIAGRALDDDDEVTVSGTVRRLTVAEVERELGWDLDQAVEVEFREKPVLVADTINMDETQAMWSEKDHPQGTVVGVMHIWTAPDLAQLAGQAITIRDIPVRRKAGQVMWLGYNEIGEILAVSSDAAAAEGIEEGTRVTVSGTLERTPPAAQVRKSWNLPQAMQTEIAGEPLYINATSVTKTPGGEMTLNTRR